MPHEVCQLGLRELGANCADIGRVGLLSDCQVKDGNLLADVD